MSADRVVRLRVADSGRSRESRLIRVNSVCRKPSPGFDMMEKVPQYLLSPNYSFTFGFEKQFVQQKNREWMRNNWHQAFYWVAAYMLVVFGIKAFMQNRAPYNLRKALAVWSTLLAAFSILGSIRTLPEMMHTLYNFGFYHSVCNPSYVEVTQVSGCWAWLFALSKVPELGDTVFIVLRKQKLIFLHWYHHITVLLFTWYFYWQHISPARWYICMNYVVHSIMYSYYALRAFGIRLPRSLAMLITASQIIQMVVGCYVTYYGVAVQAEGKFCQITEGTANLGLIMYGSYFVLFAHFFVKSYFAKNAEKQQSNCNGVKDEVKHTSIKKRALKAD